MENVVAVPAHSAGSGQAALGAASTTESGRAGGLGRDERRGMLAHMARFLDSLAVLATRVLDGVSIGEARAVFVEERPICVQPLADPASRPRGREHPLMTLVKLAVSSCRLQMRVLRSEAEAGADMVPESEVTQLEGFIENLKGMAKGLGLDPEAA